MTQKEKIEEIANRAAKLANCPPMDIQMDLTACIEGGCPLRLDEMRTASDASLMHDIYGINKHLNHETYKLEGGFWPRFAGKQ